VFSWKPIITWYAVAIPPGDYTVQQLNDEFQLRIESMTNEESQISILLSTIMIEAPNYVVDIYNSSIRTVLGWPENPPTEHHPVLLTYYNSVYENGIHDFYKNFASMKIIN
jgi:hypothetical protein